MLTLQGEAEQWMGPNVPNGGRTANHAETVGGTLYHEGKKVQLGLEHQASQWPGPDLGNNKSARAMTASTNNGRRNGGGQSSPPGLEQVARIVTGDVPAEMIGIDLPEATAALIARAPKWPGPAARDHKGSIQRQDGKSRSDMLDYAAEQFFHPPSSPDQPIAGGAMSSTAGPNSNQPSVKRKLNPIFVEALMRWPTGLSDFERQEMVSIPSLRPSPICVCQKGYENAERARLSALRRDDATPDAGAGASLGEASLLQSGLQECGPSACGAEMRAVRGDLPTSVHSEAGPPVLLPSVRECGEADQGAVSQDARWGEGQDSPSGHEGARAWETTDTRRGRPPSRREQAEQRAGELGSDDEPSPLTRAHERQPECAPLSALDIWWHVQLSYALALCSPPTPPAQGSLL